jgi:predicted acylesterase/phospholipase RssA
MVTSYDLEAAQPYFFKSYRAPDPATGAIPDDFLAWQAARSTSAAPTYFPAYRLEPPGGPARALVDGGVLANNPAMCAVADASRLFPDGASDTVDYQAAEMAHPYYFRFQEPDAGAELDDASEASIARLARKAEALVAANAKKLRELASELAT